MGRYALERPEGLVRTDGLVTGLTQRELAARLGVTQQAVAQAERWDANPSLGLLHRWAAAPGSVLSFEPPVPPDG